jgi:hypothetical protein
MARTEEPNYPAAGLRLLQILEAARRDFQAGQLKLLNFMGQPIAPAAEYQRQRQALWAELNRVAEEVLAQAERQVTVAAAAVEQFGSPGPDAARFDALQTRLAWARQFRFQVARAWAEMNGDDDRAKQAYRAFVMRM